MLYSHLGLSKKVNGEHWLETKKGESGYILYGPYVRLAPGRYAVTVHIRLRSTHLKNVVCCKLDIAASGSRVVAQQSLRSAQLAGVKGGVCMTFAVERDDVFEFRVHATGKAALAVKADTDLRLILDENADFRPILGEGERSENQFFMRNFDRFKELHAVGFSFDVAAGDIIAHHAGLSFHVENDEDLMIINEIFLVNEYHLISRRNKLVVDIGMNIGLTSLFMANMASVQEVHAFEPFATPYRRALRNLALNPAQAGKITPNNVGLGGKDETLTVRISPSETVGLSVRGVDVGDLEEIHVRGAADIIGDLAARARDRDLELIVKMDCEGSEFPIFEALETHGLLGQIDALVIEWHRWWSPEKTQQDLIRALLAADFLVIDRTNPAGVYSGLLYAIRRPS